MLQRSGQIGIASCREILYIYVDSVSIKKKPAAAAAGALEGGRGLRSQRGADGGDPPAAARPPRQVRPGFRRIPPGAGLVPFGKYSDRSEEFQNLRIEGQDPLG